MQPSATMALRAQTLLLASVGQARVCARPPVLDGTGACAGLGGGYAGPWNPWAEGAVGGGLLIYVGSMSSVPVTSVEAFPPPVCDAGSGYHASQPGWEAPAHSPMTAASLHSTAA